MALFRRNKTAKEFIQGIPNGDFSPTTPNWGAVLGVLYLTWLGLGKVHGFLKEGYEYRMAQAAKKKRR